VSRLAAVGLAFVLIQQPSGSGGSPAPRHAAEEAFVASVSDARLLADVRALVALGPRMGGTPSGDRAADWLQARFAAMGLEVRVVTDPARPSHWHERWALAIEGDSQPLASAHPYGFSPDLPAGPPRGLLFVPDLHSAEPSRDWHGKALYTRGAPQREIGRLVEAGIRPALVITSAPHRAGAYTDWASLGSLPARAGNPVAVFAVSFNDGVRLEAAAARGAAVRADLETTVSEGAPRTVIATLPGRDTARYYLVSAHGDSDSGGPGADDNASGEATVLELARVAASLRRSGVLAEPPVSLRFVVWGTEYASARAYIEREGDALAGCLGVINFDQTGTGAEREAIYFESNDVPWNERLLRTLEQVGRDYAGQPGAWPEFATNPSQGGTDSYAFLPREYRGAGYTTRRIPATTIYTAAWDETRRLRQTPGWTSSGNGDPSTVVVDYSRYYHSTGDLPEHTTDREPQNMVRAVKAAGIALLRLVYDAPGTAVPR
jgi:hypothetical protein